MVIVDIQQGRTWAQLQVAHCWWGSIVVRHEFLAVTRSWNPANISRIGVFFVVFACVFACVFRMCFRMCFSRLSIDCRFVICVRDFLLVDDDRTRTRADIQRHSRVVVLFWLVVID